MHSNQFTHCSLLRMNRRPILSRDVNNTDF
uniref:Uncharacterized protein n=1 Tax=Anguilla anguilla TaxID=7936 RepID=A0A0E9QTT2_ANGAN